MARPSSAARLFSTICATLITPPTVMKATSDATSLFLRSHRATSSPGV
ncbi:MAG: hypothetical protein U0441_20895 [Polyangiaceae bacterium]